MLKDSKAPAEVSVPGGHIFVGESRGDVKHDDGALPVDVVAVPQAPKFLLPACKLFFLRQ